jgi:hypothetical protein
MRDIISLCVRRIEGSPSVVQGVPAIHRVDRDNHSCISFRDRGGGRSNGREYRDRGRDNNPRAPQERPHPQRGPRWLTCPDRNCPPFLPNVQYTACKRVGHVAKHCDMLATAICLECYMKRDLLDSLRDAIEKDWLARWKVQLENPERMPRQVLHAYVEELNITVAWLDAAMEWDCWEDDHPHAIGSDNSSELLGYGPD